MVARVSAIALKACQFSVRFPINSTSNYLPFEMTGCKSRFIKTPLNAGVNVYRCLTDNGISIITPFLKKIIVIKKLDSICYSYVE